MSDDKKKCYGNIEIYSGEFPRSLEILCIFYQVEFELTPAWSIQMVGEKYVGKVVNTGIMSHYAVKDPETGRLISIGRAGVGCDLNVSDPFLVKGDNFVLDYLELIFHEII